MRTLQPSADRPERGHDKGETDDETIDDSKSIEYDVSIHM